MRVIAPDVGGAFGYKCVLQPEELCVAWLALTFKTPFRWIEDRREHLISGANCREHHYTVTAYADERGKLLGFNDLLAGLTGAGLALLGGLALTALGVASLALGGAALVAAPALWILRTGAPVGTAPEAT